MEFLTINLKENNPTVAEAIANFEIAVETYRGKLKAIKFIHGYGSHGRGGNILLELKKLLPIYVKRGVIKDYISGADWNFNHKKTFDFILTCAQAAADEDLNHGNTGITIVIL